MVDYAKTLGFSEREFKNKPALREAVKKAYHIANAAEIAARKEVKPNPQQVAAPAGRAGGVVDEGNDEEKILMNPDTPTDVRMSIWAKRKK